MPYFSVTTNKEIDAGAANALAEKTPGVLAEVLEKPAKYIMVSITQGVSMAFFENTEPAAFVELKSIGLPPDKLKDYSKAICEYLETEIGVAKNRIYIDFKDLNGKMFGFNCGTC